MRSRIFLLSLSVLTFLSGCGEERTRPPPTSLAVINAAPGFSNLSLRRGRLDAAILGQVNFPGVFNARFDSDTYNFDVATIETITGVTIELTSFTETLGPDERYVFVLAEQNRQIVPVRVSRPPLAAGSANWELTVVNAAEGIPNVDVFLTPPGTDPSAATPLGAVAFGESLLTESLSPGEYNVILTENGNPANVLFTSAATTFNAGVWTQFAIVPDVNGVDGVVSLIVRAETAFNLTDVNAPTKVRLFNGAADGLPRDFYVGGDFTTPLAAGVEFGTATDFLGVPNSTNQISVTPAGNVSVVEAEFDQALFNGTSYEMVVAGPAGSLEIAAEIDNPRRNNVNARVLLINSVSYYGTLNTYLVRPGTDITTRFPNWTITSPAATTRAEFPPDSYVLTVTDAATNTVVLEPVPLTLELRGIYTFALIDSGDGTNVSVVLLDDFE